MSHTYLEVLHVLSVLVLQHSSLACQQQLYKAMEESMSQRQLLGPANIVSIFSLLTASSLSAQCTGKIIF